MLLASASGPGGLPPMNHHFLAGPMWLKMLLPGKAAELVERPGGAVSFIESTRANVRLSPPGIFFPGTSDRVISVSGQDHQLDQAVPVLLRAVIDGVGMDSSSVTAILAMPTSGIKYVVGKQGIIVKAISAAAGTNKIYVHEQVGNYSHERMIVINGPQQSVETAIYDIYRKVQQCEDLMNVIDVVPDPHARMVPSPGTFGGYVEGRQGVGGGVAPRRMVEAPMDSLLPEGEIGVYMYPTSVEFLMEREKIDGLETSELYNIERMSGAKISVFHTKVFEDRVSRWPVPAGLELDHCRVIRISGPFISVEMAHTLLEFCCAKGSLGTMLFSSDLSEFKAEGGGVDPYLLYETILSELTERGEEGKEAAGERVEAAEDAMENGG